MPKTITSNQLLGEIGEAAVRLRFLNMGFQFDGRSRLEASVDGIAEVMDKGKPLARMIAVQVKARESANYSAEDETGFTYLLRPDDLAYWRGYNLPIILVLYRKSDETYFWKEATGGTKGEDRRLQFDKQRDVLDASAVDRLAALTVPKAGFGYYVPPLGGGEEALVNILPVTLPSEIFASSTPYKNHHKHYPARVIVLKTSQFREEEADGILEAIDEAGAELRDLVWVQESYSVKVLRDGNYPVMRGTFVELDGKGLLYTNGSIPYYGTYPGLYDPRPLLLCPYKGHDSTLAQIASEVLSLTKINWNSTQMNQKLPIPIRAARAVGEVLKYVTDKKISSDYARYI